MLKQQIFRGTVWLIGGRLVSQALGLVSTIVAARLLLPADFGLVAIAMGIFTIGSAVVELPVGAALVQLKVATKEDFDTAWTLNFLRGCIVSALMLAAAWPMAYAFSDHRLIDLVSIFALYPFLLGLRNSYFEQYIRDMVFKWEAMVEIGTKVGSLLVTAIIAYVTGSYWALPLGLIASGVIAVFMSYALCPKFPGLSLKRFRTFFDFSIWLGLAHIADGVRDAFTTFVLGKTLGSSKLGSYAVGSQFGERLEQLLFSSLDRTLFSAFSSIQDDRNRLRAAYLSSVHISFAVALPVCAGVGLLAPYVVAITLGPEWALTGLVLAFIAPTAAFYMLGGASVSLCIALRRTRSVFLLKLMTLGLYVALLAAGIYAFGLVGALSAGIVTAVIWCLLSFRMISRVLDVPVLRQLGVVSRSFAATAVMAAGVLPVQAALGSVTGDNMLSMIVEATSLAALGAGLYIASHMIIWIASGRPEGIESAVFARLKAKPD